MHRRSSIRAGEGTSWLRGRNKGLRAALFRHAGARPKEVPYFFRNDKPISMDPIAAAPSSGL
jgi:hypothetical protein